MAHAATASRAVVVRSPRPQVITVRAPRASPKKKHRTHHRGHSNKKVLIGMAVGGLVLGFVDKGGLGIPTIPILGKAGTIALVTYFISKGGAGVLGDVCKAATAVAAYQFGFAGKIAGDDVSGDGIASQV